MNSIGAPSGVAQWNDIPAEHLKNESTSYPFGITGVLFEKFGSVLYICPQSKNIYGFTNRFVSDTGKGKCKHAFKCIKKFPPIA